MDSEPFLESCRLDDERELQRASYLPSLAEIAFMERQIRDERDAKAPPTPHFKMNRAPRVFRMSRYGQRNKKHPWVE
jgi:hypothetical protein